MKNISMLSALLLTLSVCAVSAAPTTATRNSAAKSKAPVKQSVGSPTLGTSVLSGGVLPGSAGVPKPLGAGQVLVVGSGGTLVWGGVSYPAGTYVVDKDGKLVLDMKMSMGPFRK